MHSYENRYIPPPTPQSIPTSLATPKLRQFEFEVVTLTQVATIKVIEEKGFWGNKKTRETTEISLQTQKNCHQAQFYFDISLNCYTI
ncbi:hypothetical protein [Merismopedia glauca]|uniref:hypothetical protein n=1 Tax=Merismopedia glauca TaxID=292586 RepID=UPI0011B268FC|nr:hypothetical protein [Merismopedia glauca]